MRVHWNKNLMQLGVGVDPTYYCPQNSFLRAPWYRTLKEASFSCWYGPKGYLSHQPLMEGHGLRDEVVEDFYRGQMGFGGWHRGHDIDNL